MARRFNIALIQDKPGSGISDFHKSIIRDAGVDIIAFPEYYFVNADEKNVLESFSRRGQILDELLRLSSDFRCLVIGGSLVDREDGAFRNRCYVIQDGNIIGHYDKIHPYGNEGKGQISPGWEYRVFHYGGIRIGVLICADVLYPASFANLRGLRPSLTFIPTTSPYRPEETRDEKFDRDMRIFASGAAMSNSLILKVSASGAIAGHRLQARSLIASPGKILWRIEPEDEDRPALIIARIDCDVANPSLDIDVHRR